MSILPIGLNVAKHPSPGFFVLQTQLSESSFSPEDPLNNIILQHDSVELTSKTGVSILLNNAVGDRVL